MYHNIYRSTTRTTHHHLPSSIVEHSAGRVIGRAKKLGRNSYGGFGIGSTVSPPTSIWVRETVKRCCSCTRHLTCSTTGPSDRACDCCNSVRQCTGCYCLGWCKNRGRLMPSPTTVRGLSGNFLSGADPPAADHRVSPLSVRLPTYLSLQVILASGPGKEAQGAAQEDAGTRKMAEVGVGGQG